MRRRLTNTLMGGLACMVLFATYAAAQGGELVAAEYGEGSHRVDVTPQVRRYLHNGILHFNVSDQELGVDPAHGHVKELFIRVRHWDGNTEEFKFPEHAEVNLNLDPDRGYEWHDRNLHIMRAFYGGAGHFKDVTETINSQVRDNRIVFLVENRTMGGDPDPEVHKVLRVLYWYDGQRRQAVIPENSELRLP